MADMQIPALMPYFQVSNTKESLEWFGKLGFETTYAMNGPDGSIFHAEVTRGPLRFMLGPTMGGLGSPGLGLFINLKESVDAYHDTVKAAGVEISQPLQDQFWGDRTFNVKHPDGYEFTFGEHIRDVSPEEMEKAAAEWMAAGAPA